MDVPESESVLKSGLIAAYRATCFRVDHDPPFTLTVDVRSPELDFLLCSGDYAGAAYVTAWNPLGEELSLEENERLQEALVEELRMTGLRWLTGAGTDPSGAWPHEEASLLILGIDRRAACELGRRHGQNAILWIGTDGVPRLVLLR